MHAVLQTLIGEGFAGLIGWPEPETSALTGQDSNLHLTVLETVARPIELPAKNPVALRVYRLDVCGAAREKEEARPPDRFPGWMF